MKLLLNIFTILLLSQAIYAYGCQRELGGKVYDFSQFNEMNQNSYSQISTINGKNYTFYFDFCRQASDCRAGSSACMKYSNNDFNVEDSLGSTNDFQINPLANGLEGANLTYVNGDDCGHYGPRVTSIIMTCSNSYTQITAITQPSTCIYQIEVSSYYACPINTKGPKCKIFVKGNNNPKYDLTPLKNNIYNIIGTGAPLNEYMLSYSICGSFITCNLNQPAPAVCLTKIDTPTVGDSGGSYTQTTLNEASSGVNLDYQGGSLCGINGNRLTSINITCDPSTEYQILSADELSTCIYNVKMKSKHACAKF